MLKLGYQLRGRPRIALGLLFLAFAGLLLGGCSWLLDWAFPGSPPIAVIAISGRSGLTPFEITVDASESYDPHGQELSDFLWDFGDGTAANGKSVVHTFATPGTYTVELIVTDETGRSSASSVEVTAAQIVDATTGLDGTAQFLCGAVTVGVRVVDDRGAPVQGIGCRVVTDNTSGIALATDPLGRYIPAIACLGEEPPVESVRLGAPMRPQYAVEAIREAILYDWGSLDAGAKVLSEQYLPEGLTLEFVNENYERWMEPMMLKDLPGAVGEEVIVLEPTSNYLDGMVILALLSVPVVGVAAAAAYEAISVASTLDSLAVQIAVDLAVTRYHDRGYADDQEFLLYKAKSFLQLRSVLILPTGPPRGGSSGGVPSSSTILRPADVALPCSAAGTEQSLQFVYRVELLGAETYFTASIDPGGNAYSRPVFSQGSYSGTLRYIAPSAGETSTFTIQGQMSSSAEGQSNRDSETVSFTARVASSPDLTVSDVTSPSSARSGDSIPVSYTVRNEGGPAFGSFENRLFLSTKRFGGGQDVLLGEYPMELGESRSARQTVEVTIPELSAGDWYVAVFSDPTNAIEETNENNNIRSSPIALRENLPSAVTLTLYMHDESTSGPTLPGVAVTGQDGAGSEFGQTTNTSGYVTLTGQPGTWHFSAAKNGYQTKAWTQETLSTTAAHAYLAANAVSNVTLTLYIHEGSTGNPGLPGVQVCGTDGAGASFDVNTNAAGYVTILGRPGTWSFTISKVGYASDTWSWTVSWTTTRHASILGQSTGITVALHVYEDGVSGSPPIAGALVEGSDGAGDAFSGTTDAAGNIAIQGGVGRWWIEISKAGFYPYEWNEPLTASTTRSASLRRIVEEATLRVYVHEDASLGATVEGARVEVRNTAGEYFSGYTNTSGYVTVVGASGDWTFAISKSGYESTTWRQVIYSSTGELHLWLGGVDTTVTVAVYLHENTTSGDTIPNARIQGTDGVGRAFDVTTNAEGYATITGELGAWYLTASKDGYGTTSWGTRFYAWSDTTVHASLEKYVERISIFMYVHAGSDTGPVIPGAYIQGHDGVGNPFGCQSDCYTNPDGFRSLTGEPGVWHFSISRPGYQTRTWDQSITTDLETVHKYLVEN